MKYPKTTKALKILDAFLSNTITNGDGWAKPTNRRLVENVQDAHLRETQTVDRSNIGYIRKQLAETDKACCENMLFWRDEGFFGERNKLTIQHPDGESTACMQPRVCPYCGAPIK